MSKPLVHSLAARMAANVIVEFGTSEVDESALTGESVLVHKNRVTRSLAL